MTETNLHRAIATDGTRIAGTVRGQGPPLVLVHGALGDGDTVWAPVLPHLTEHFTCYTPSTRGRGRSDDHADHAMGRLVDDLTAFVDSIGEPASLLGLSNGAALAIGAAARSASVAAVVAYEPPVLEVIDEDTFTRFLTVTGQVGELAQQGRAVDATRTFLELVSNARELDALEEADVFASFADTVPAFLRDADGLTTGPSPTDPAALQRVTAPTLLLRGPETALRWLGDGVDAVAAHLPNSRVVELPGAGHLGPMTHPQLTAAEVVAFLAPRHTDRGVATDTMQRARGGT